MAHVKGTILLVEDEDFVREVTSQVLQFAGYGVLKAKNAMDAISQFRRHQEKIELLLTDIVMPGKNGHDLAHDLSAVCPGLRTIFISGYPENAITRNGWQERGVLYLPKPFSVQSLLRKVKLALRGAGLPSGRGP